MTRAVPGRDELEGKIGELLDHGSALRSMSIERIAAAVTEVARAFGDAGSSVGAEARSILPTTTGLSGPMVDWALSTAAASMTPEAVEAVAELATRARPGLVAAHARLATVVLAGNVFTAPLTSMIVPLLVRVPVIAKASSADDTLPLLLRDALRKADPDVGACVEVTTFPGGTLDLERALFARADVVGVHGNDDTIRDVRARIPSTALFVPHGHGLGAAFVPSSALVEPKMAADVAEQVALDVAAYDQRGCMSLHMILVEPGSVQIPAFAQMVARSLGALGSTLPRGPLPAAEGAAQLQWRGVAAVRGELFEGDGFATSYEGDTALRPSPGWRNVSVYRCSNVHELGKRLEPFGVHLKALAVAADAARHQAIAAALPPPLAPRICEPGQMQRPPFGSTADGADCWTGLLRWIQID